MSHDKHFILYLMNWLSEVQVINLVVALLQQQSLSVTQVIVVGDNPLCVCWWALAVVCSYASSDHINKLCSTVVLHSGTIHPLKEKAFGTAQAQ